MRKLPTKDGVLLCINPKELLFLLNLKDLPEISKIAFKNLNSPDRISKSITDLAIQISKTKDYELWTAIFILYEDFKDSNFEICFYVSEKDEVKVKTLTDLVKYRQEDNPIDIVILKDQGSINIQIKRYTGKLEKGNTLFK